MMKVILWGALLAMMIPVASEAASLRYAERVGDWYIGGWKTSQYNFSCRLNSAKAGNQDFVYVVAGSLALSPDTEKNLVILSTSLAEGPVSAIIVGQDGKKMNVFGTVVKSERKAILTFSSEQASLIRDALTNEKSITVTLSSQTSPASPSQTFTVSMDRGSDAYDSLLSCLYSIVD